MTQYEALLAKYGEVKTNTRTPSKHNDDERESYLHWMKHNRKLFAAGC